MLNCLLAWTQTSLSFPPILPAEVEEVLRQYMNDPQVFVKYFYPYRCKIIFLFYCRRTKQVIHLHLFPILIVKETIQV